MSFNSHWFFCFLGCLLLIYFFLPQRMQNRLLLLASYLFYGTFDYRFLVLIFTSTLVDFIAALKISGTELQWKRKLFLGCSLGVNLGLLFVFKYLNFFWLSVERLLALFGAGSPAPVFQFILPAAISFYTFRTISYTIDVYRGQQTPVKDFFDYALYVSFFPQLLAGPIERASRFLPQLRSPRSFRRDHLVQGTWLILFGFFKKMVVADNLAVFADAAFNGGTSSTGMQMLIGVYAFTFQIYCDFSGYTDIARGIGKLLGFETSINFDRPYLSKDPVEFWRRWHISLSFWLRDYVFLPLTYILLRRIKKPHWKLKSESWTYITGVMATMVLCGLWHGAAWTFVVWGGYQGILIVLHHLITRWRKRPHFHGLPVKICKIVCFFHLTALGWLVFRSGSLQEAWLSIRRIFCDFSPAAGDWPQLVLPSCFLLLMGTVGAWTRNQDDPRGSMGWNLGLGPAAVVLLALMVVVFAHPSNPDFIYNQF